MRLSPIEKFWSMVDKNGPIPNHVDGIGNCWQWTGRIMHKGYGVASFTIGRSHQQRAHRLSWFLSHGEWPSLCVLHRCDNRRCVRPDHLFLGTVADNAKDMVSKGRHNCTDRDGKGICPESFARGEKHGSAKLNKESVREIVFMRAAGYSLSFLGRRFNVSGTTIGSIGVDTWTRLVTPELLSLAAAEAKITRERIEAEAFVGDGI